jgi:hypothetical protein
MADAKLTKLKTVSWRGKRHTVRALASKWQVKLEAKFAAFQGTRKRNAVYAYLTAVYTFARGFKTSADCRTVGRRMIRKEGLVLRKRHDRFSLIIRATSDVNEKTRWKWMRCLQFAHFKDVEPGELETFIRKDHNGINECASKLG